MAFDSNDQRIQIHVEILTDIGQSQEGTPVDTGLTMHVHSSHAIAQKRMHDGFKPWKPLHDIGLERIRSFHTSIPIGVLYAKPLGRILRVRTVNDVGDPTLHCEPRRQKDAWSDENSRVKIDRGLPKIVGDCHC